MWEVAQCSRFKESKAYLAAILKALPALPLDPTQHPDAIKTLRALVGRLTTIRIAIYQLFPAPTHANQLAADPAETAKLTRESASKSPSGAQFAPRLNT